MVIVQLSDGLGNQFDQYAVAKNLAHKLNTELKIDLSKSKILNGSHANFFTFYHLGDFNIQENFATPEEIARVEKHGLIINKSPLPDLENFHGDIFIQGHWMHDPKYYEDIADILRKEFTLKKLSDCALDWQKKILAAECSVSLHFRHGDYLYNPQFKKERWAGIPPLDYYYTCIDILKREYKNMTAFVFSDNIQWVKENFHFDVPTDFVSGNGTSDTEEFFLMSLCKHNIIASSTFSKGAAFLNANPDKKCFIPDPSNAEDTRKTLDWINANKISPSNLDTWIKIPYDFDNRFDIDLRPYFSLLMVVNNDIDTLEESLNSILAQDYKYYEVIIIDNASYDGSRQICQKAAKISDKVKLIKLYDKVSNGAAWNMALSVAQGYFVMFFKGDDRIFPDTFTSAYYDIQYNNATVVNSAAWLSEDDEGTVSDNEKNFALQGYDTFRGVKKAFVQKFDKPTILKLLTANERAVPIATKFFDRKFLLDNAIKFDEKISDADAELLFMSDTMLRANEMLFVPNPLYIAPKI